MTEKSELDLEQIYNKSERKHDNTFDLGSEFPKEEEINREGEVREYQPTHYPEEGKEKDAHQSNEV